MKKIITAAAATLIWVLASFIWPIFWSKWKAHFGLDSTDMSLPAMVAMIFWMAFTGGIFFLWYRATKEGEEK